MVGDPYEDLQIEAAAAEAARVGGEPQEREPDPALRPLREAGKGEAEGFEEAEHELIEHASHGDYQSAHSVIHQQGRPEEPGAADGGEPDHELSSEYDPEADEQA